MHNHRKPIHQAIETSLPSLKKQRVTQVGINNLNDIAKTKKAAITAASR
jgi:hypothetical protein